MSSKDNLTEEDTTLKSDETNSVNDAIVAAAVAAAAESVLNNNNSTVETEDIIPLPHRKKAPSKKKEANSNSNIETHFQNQIQSQLQNQIQDELRLTNHADENNPDTHNMNLLDSTNIDDELRNLENFVSKEDESAVIDSSVVHYDSGAAASKPNQTQSTTEHIDNENLESAIDVMAKLEDIRSGNENIPNGSKKLSGKYFYLPVESAENENLKSLILSCGGKIANEHLPNSCILVPSREKALQDRNRQYLYELIYHTYMKKATPNFEKYRIDSEDVETRDGSKLEINIGSFPINKDVENFKGGDITDDSLGKRRIIKNLSPVPKRKSKKFTKEEDDFILDLVRRNPHLRSTHTFFARISQLAPLSEHTGNSIRYRYRKILAPTLAYVYKIDPATGKPEIDPETNEPLKVEEIPSLIKSQYTADEDYLLCRHILSFKNGEMILLGKRKQEISHIPEAVFQELNKINPRHSTFSWRDRYRKFAAKYGLRRYVAYYEDSVKKNIRPEPMKNMSSRADRKDYKVDVFENEVKRSSTLKQESLKRSGEQIEAEMKKIKIAKSTPNAAETNETEVSEEKPTSDDIAVDPILESESVSTAAGALKALANVSTEHRNFSNKNKTKNIGDKEIKEADKPAAQNANGANLFVDATEDEMKQYDIALNDTTIEGLTDSKKKKNEGAVSVPEVVTNSNDSNNDVELINVKADDGLMDFRQLLDIDPEPLKHRDEINLEVMVSNIQDCFRKFGDGNTPYELFKDISDQTGISMLWLNYWFDCSCGMLGTFIQAIIHYLETGELVMNNVSGFWTEKDDELLKMDPENKELLNLHGKDSVTKRKAVLLNFVI